MIEEYTLPPPNVNLEKQEKDRAEREWSSEGDNSPLAYLEIEVSRIRLVKSIRANSPNSTSTSSGEITAKIIWWGEQRDKAGTVSISCDRTARKLAQQKRSNRQQRHLQQQLQQQLQKEEQIEGNGKEEQGKLWQREKKKKRSKKGKKQQQQQHPAANTNTNTVTDTNKLRYSVRSKSLAVFLDYLRQCPAIEIVAAVRSDVSSSSHAYGRLQDSKPPPKPDPDPALAHGHTLLPLPTSLLRKYAANYGSGCNFEHKTKIYALYRHLEIGGPLEQVQQQQQLKVGHIQLRFKMLFAEPPPLPPLRVMLAVPMATPILMHMHMRKLCNRHLAASR